MQQNLAEIRDEQRRSWDKFSAGWKKWDGVVMNWLAPVGDALIANVNLREHSHLLDVAAGTGEPGLSAACLVPQGMVTITDLADGMLTVVAENAARRGITNIATRQCDVSAMPFDDACFDAVTCRFGLMFFPDMVMGLKEMTRVAKPGARVSCAVWGVPAKNPWATTMMSTIGAHVALPVPTPDMPSLFRCAAPGFAAGLFKNAGLKNVVEMEVAGDLVFESPEQYWDMLTEVAAPVVEGLSRADAKAREEIRSTVLDLARQTATDGTARFHWSALVVTGEK